jgi:hypothetical protein
MNTTPSVVRDERTVAVENAGSRWTSAFIIYALLLDGMYRGFFLQEAAWDLLAIVIVGGGIGTIYQARQKAMPVGWPKMAIRLAFIAFVGGFIAAFIQAILIMTKGS